jgi:hypothetical protein
MKLIAHGLAVSASLIALQALADCEMPTLVASIPDGATASEDQLLATQSEVRAYIAAMDGYIACQNEDLRARGDNATSDYLFQMATRIDAARSEVDAVATSFNEAVMAFRAARPPRVLAPEGQSPLQPPVQQSPLQQQQLRPQQQAPPQQP